MVPCRLAQEQDAIAFGRHVAGRLVPGSVVALVGGLGAGKTHVAKGIAAALGYPGEVTSPTFTLVHEYVDPSMACPMYHFDFYRLRTPDEVLGLGWDEYLEAGGICVVEWADLFPDLLPPDAQWWRLSFAEDGSRRAEAIASPPAQSAPPAVSTDPSSAP
ncbi:MAG: tRNA (adenosine(37)-N6)-threonylcarbamoyltransferase complex ATPase subunit type 1 TsaE [Verrucomicrobiales bacterium]